MKLKTTAEHLVWLLAAHGVEYLFLNPGTDTAPVQEAVADSRLLCLSPVTPGETFGE